MAQRQVPSFVLIAINHLIKQEVWAEKLIDKHLGKTVKVGMSLGEFVLLIRPGGFANAPEDINQEPKVSLQIANEAIFEALSGGKAGAAKHVRISGDVDLAHDLSTLAGNLRWEAEEDLAKWIGDAPAHRISVEGKKAVTAGKKAVEDLKGGLRDYLVHEKRAIIPLPEFENFKKEIRELRDGVERAEKRIERLIKSFE